MLVSNPDTPSTLQEERESGEYSTTFLYLCGISEAQLIDWCANNVTYTVLPYHKPLSFTPLQT